MNAGDKIRVQVFSQIEELLWSHRGTTSAWQLERRVDKHIRHLVNEQTWIRGRKQIWDRVGQAISVAADDATRTWRGYQGSDPGGGR